MTELLKRIEEWSKRTDLIIDRDRCSIGLFVLVLAGFCLQLPLMLNGIIQICFFACSIHLTYYYVNAGHWLLALLKIGLVVTVGLVDDIYFHIIFSQ